MNLAHALTKIDRNAYGTMIKAIATGYVKKETLSVYEVDNIGTKLYLAHIYFDSKRHHRLEARATPAPRVTGGYPRTEPIKYNYRAHTRHLLPVSWRERAKR